MNRRGFIMRGITSSGTFDFVVSSLANQSKFGSQNQMGYDYQLGEIIERIATDYGAVHIETQKIFDQAAPKVCPQHWIWDGVHPLPKGHELIARNWLQAVTKATNKEA